MGNLISIRRSRNIKKVYAHTALRYQEDVFKFANLEISYDLLARIMFKISREMGALREMNTVQKFDISVREFYEFLNETIMTKQK